MYVYIFLLQHQSVNDEYIICMIAAWTKFGNIHCTCTMNTVYIVT